jgi:hypothetical protein
LEAEKDVRKLMSLMEKWEREGVMVGGQFYNDGINALVASAENKRQELINLKNGVRYEPYPVPNISCCQSIDFKELSADKITFNNIDNSCTTPNAPQPNAPSQNDASQNDASQNDASPSYLINKKTIGGILIVGIVVLFVLIMVLLLNNDEAPISKN